MILKDFYTEKKNAIETEFSTNAPAIQLYSDAVFKTTIDKPLVMFKYDTISWETSSEKNYKADVSFCLYIVLPIDSVSSNRYEQAFEMAYRLDKAILSGTSSNSFLDTNSTFKAKEKQYTNEEVYWNKNDYFIWEITYKTTLIENILKKKYILFNNGLSNEELEELGYDLNSGIIGINPNQVEGDVDLKINS
ncbi:hypothetical protein FLA105534_04111 [Flavobacterium bizetiae]|uniref:Uncharacterized protein n=1 Tax=Flavobacterium bizetiae TaxID=2704140 RepID=A0A6J4GT49_9FLAO|nr:hypothetical protein [Flavobacterium bizetiae]CAA9202490.1 hypothetical protein FLA105534_04111 [Flavobacterium bizetiae]CAD5340472.1 hypothetical protein FLA105535_00426 [Flavobacterium bizetiae]CAD5346875.1 hypothetical protein FLA105534_00818 [Flavobacterium bizetiae]